MLGEKSPVLHTFSFYPLRDFVDNCEIDARHVHVHAYSLVHCVPIHFLFLKPDEYPDKCNDSLQASICTYLRS